MFPRMVLPIHCEITDGILRGVGRAFHVPAISPPGSRGCQVLRIRGKRGAGCMQRGDRSMNRVRIVVALALLAVTAGCQASRPAYNFPCTPHAYDAGLCEQPSWNLVGRVFDQQ